MTVSPSPGPNSGGDRNPRRRWLRIAAISGGVLVAIGLAGTLSARYVVYRRLGGIVETSLATLINRPVEIGPITGFSLTGIQIDGAAIPPTLEDEDYAKVPKIEVRFNPIVVVQNLVRDRTLPITLTFIDPELYIQEDANGNWVELMIQSQEAGPISLALETINAKNATLIVAPYPQAYGSGSDTGVLGNPSPGVKLGQTTVENPPATPVIFQAIDAIAHLRDKNRYIEAEVTGKALGGGTFDLIAEADIQRPQVNANLRTQSMQVVQFNDFLQALVPLPATLQAGSLDSNLTFEYDKGDDLPSINGTAQVNDIVASSDLAPKPLSDLNSLLSFSGRTVTLDQTSLRYDQVNVTASGSVDLDSGFNLVAQVQPITLQDLQSTADIQFPIQASGRLEVEVDITGPLEQPLVTGLLRNADPIQVDRMVAETVMAKFALTPSLFTLQQLAIAPAVGGTITGQGKVNLGDNIGVLLDVEVQDIPTDAIAALYDLTLPSSTRLGSLNSTIGVFGDIANIQAALKWNLVGGNAPAQGDIFYGDQIIRVRDTVVRIEPGSAPNLEGLAGTLTANANAFLAENRWDAQVNVDGVEVNPLLPQAQGRLSSNLMLSGVLNQLTPEAVNVTGTAILADALVTLNPDMPPILDRGDWTTAFAWVGTGLSVDRFVAPGLRADGFITTNLQGNLTPEAIIQAIDLNVAVDPYDLNRLQAFIPAEIKTQLEAQIAPYTTTTLYPQGHAQFQGKLTGTLAQLQLDGTTTLSQLAIANLEFAPSLRGPVTFGLGRGGSVDLTGDGDRIYARLDERYLPTDFEVRASQFVATGALDASDRLTAAIENFDLASLGIRPLSRPDLGPVQGLVNLNLVASLADLTNPQVDGKVAIARPGLGTVAANVFTGAFRYGDGMATLSDGFFCIGPGQGTPNFGSMVPAATVVDADSPTQSPTPEELCANTSTFRVAAVVDVFNAAIQSSQLTIEQGHIQDILTTLRWFDIDDAIQWFDFASPLASHLGTSADIELEAIALPDTPLITDQESVVGQLEYFAQWLSQWERERSTPQFALPSLQTLDGQFDGTISLAGSLRDGFSMDFDLEGQQWAWAPYLDAGMFTARGSATPDIVTFSQFQFATDNATVALNGQIGLTQPGTSNLVVENVPVPVIQGLAQQWVPQLRNAPIVLDGTLTSNIVLEGTVFNPTVEGIVSIKEPSLNQQPLELAEVRFAYNQTNLGLDNQASLSLNGAIAVKDQERLSITGQIPYALPFMTVQPITDQIALNVNIRDQGFKLVNLFTQGQVIWEEGTGAMNLGVTGTLAAPKIGGTLALQDGRISSPFLSKPITGIAGSSSFDLTQITITDPFEAHLGEGMVSISGQLPLFEVTDVTSDPDSPNELAIALQMLPIPLKNLLSARVDGDLTIRGAAIAPVISGNIGVSGGRVNVDGVLAASSGNARRNSGDNGTNVAAGDTVAGTTTNNPSAAGTSLPSPMTNPLLQMVKLDQLVINLDEPFLISRSPVFDLEVLGKLTINETLAKPSLDGDIELASGWINLFATQFRVDRGEDNLVSFRPSRSFINPDLDIVMRATVREVDRQPVAPSSPFASPEVTDQSAIPTFGGLQTVVITAQVDGAAQNLLAHLADPNSAVPNPLTLSSDPSRSERQIVALLGGEVFNALQSGNAGLAIASYVGSGFVAGLGNQVADALGLSQFSIFPATDPSGEGRLPIAIGIEAGIDLIPRRLSFSVLEVLDGTTNPQFALQYRISNQWQIRGSSDLNDDNRAIIEFRTDF